jgi:hypothetical protein
MFVTSLARLEVAMKSENSVMLYFEKGNVGISDETLSIMAVELAITDSNNSEGKKEPVVSGNTLEVMLIMSVLQIICLQ